MGGVSRNSEELHQEFDEDSDDNDESPTNLNDMRQEYNDCLAILEGHSSKTSKSPVDVCNEAMETPQIPSKDKEVAKTSDAFLPIQVKSGNNSTI